MQVRSNYLREVAEMQGSCVRAADDGDDEEDEEDEDEERRHDDEEEDDEEEEEETVWTKSSASMPIRGMNACRREVRS